MIISLALLFINFSRLESKKNSAINLENEFQNNKAKNEKNKLSKEIKKEKTKNETGDKITDNNAIGVLRVDDIKLILPIYMNTSRKALSNGCGIVTDTDMPSNKNNTMTVLAAHRGGRNEDFTFKKINELKDGSVIKITTKTQILYYEVYGYEIIEPDDWSRFIKEQDKSKLYLMSCHPYPYDSQRLLIKSKLIKSVSND